MSLGSKRLESERHSSKLEDAVRLQGFQRQRAACQGRTAARDYTTLSHAMHGRRSGSAIAVTVMGPFLTSEEHGHSSLTVTRRPRRARRPVTVKYRGFNLAGEVRYLVIAARYLDGSLWPL